jgi:type II secretory pathway pseudopilin PulG
MTPNPLPPAAGPAAPRRTPGIAITALIFGILGLCLPCPFGLVGLILGIVALSKIGSDPALDGKALGILAICLPLAGIFFSGILAAIAIPNYIKFEARAKQSECKSNLKSAYVAERSYFAEHDAYSPLIARVGFEPARGNRYAYFLDQGPVEDRSSTGLVPNPEAVAIGVDTFKLGATKSISLRDLPRAYAGEANLGVKGECPECAITIVCAGNIDNDEALDVWSISTEEREGPRGETISAGEPYNELNDVNLDR